MTIPPTLNGSEWPVFMTQRASSRLRVRGSAMRLPGLRREGASSDGGQASTFIRAHLWWPLLGMGLLIAVWTATGADFWLADHFYAWQGGRWALKEGFLTENIIHVAGRDLSTLAWLGVLVGFMVACCRTGLSNYRRPLAYLLLATLAGTLSVSWIKSWSNIDCPWDLLRYGGERPYVGLLSLRPIGLPRGACFPAGHASGGYTWLALYFFLLVVRPSLRWWGLAAGLTLGIVFGFSQQLRGAHFLSHDLWTAVVCWTVSAFLYLKFYPTRNVMVHAPEIESGRTRATPEMDGSA